MREHCKCHGLSGSCEVRICWQRLPHLASVASRLKIRYNKATKVIISNEGDSLLPAAHRSMIAKRRGGSRVKTKPPRKYELLYIRDSPDFCTRNLRKGSLGTLGRKCHTSSNTTSGCASLCCGRGYDVITEKRPRNCNCGLQCCRNCNCQLDCCYEVVCDTCWEERQSRFCK